MRVDYIVVGLGLAGLAFCEQLRKNNKSFVVFDHGPTSASTVASGLYNPIVLKRFVPAWNGHQLMQFSIPFYRTLEQTLNTTFLHPSPILRKFFSAAEANDWQHACDSPVMAPYMEPILLSNTNSGIDAPLGFGKLKGTGWVDCDVMLSAYRSFLSSYKLLIDEVFLYGRLATSKPELIYNNIEAHSIVFAEGTGMLQNPWFSYLPLRHSKGELLVIHCPDLKENNILHSGIFIIPIGEDRYKVGATYDNYDHTALPTKAGRHSLEKRLQKILCLPYKIIDHLAGLRPTTPDRRPLVGTHPTDKRIAVLNGLGSRGVLQAPFAAKSIMDYMEKDKALPAEIDVSRYAPNL